MVRFVEGCGAAGYWTAYPVAPRQHQQCKMKLLSSRPIHVFVRDIIRNCLDERLVQATSLSVMMSWCIALCALFAFAVSNKLGSLCQALSTILVCTVS